MMKMTALIIRGSVLCRWHGGLERSRVCGKYRSIVLAVLKRSLLTSDALLGNVGICWFLFSDMWRAEGWEDNVPLGCAALKMKAAQPERRDPLGNRREIPVIFVLTLCYCSAPEETSAELQFPRLTKGARRRHPRVRCKVNFETILRLCTQSVCGGAEKLFCHGAKQRKALSEQHKHANSATQNLANRMPPSVCLPKAIIFSIQRCTWYLPPHTDTAARARVLGRRKCSVWYMAPNVASDKLRYLLSQIDVLCSHGSVWSRG